MATRLALVVLGTLGAGCFPGVGTPKAFENVHADVGSSGGPSYCAIYPHLFASWDAPIKLPAHCPYEGWVRQVVRDIHDIDGCTSDQDPELHVVLAIDKRGVLTSVDVQQPISVDVRRCVDHALRDWEFASAQAPGSLLVIYRPVGRSRATSSRSRPRSGDGRTHSDAGPRSPDAPS